MDQLLFKIEVIGIKNGYENTFKRISINYNHDEIEVFGIIKKKIRIIIKLFTHTTILFS